MSDSDEDHFQLYGTLLEPYDEDAVPKKKAFTIADQIATDDHGRRRFHGAFTGGFSAGFFNTVGSLEGWQPAEFKSSRSDKAERKSQKPQDFMDDEDVGEFGIAPSVVRATSDYSAKTTRKRVMNTDGPIPGVPVLETLLQPAKDTVGIKLLKQMGWKPGQGVGPRLTKTEKRRVNREHSQNTGKIYGCEIPAEFRQKIVESSEDEDDDDDDELTFAPDDYDPFIVQPKDNTFGMGYSGLDKRPILSSHITLFDPPEFKMRDHKNSKISVSGQAFGVGAFENEDEDIYTRDDMSKYDFELETSSKKKLKKIRDAPDKSIARVLEGFVIGKKPVSGKKSFPPPVLPKNFIPKHGVRVSRFEPLPETHRLFNYDRKRTTGRHDLTASERAKIINSESVVIEKSAEKVETKVISAPFNVPPEKEKEQVKTAAKITRHPGPLNTNFKPFVTDPDKQKRYEQYLTLEKIGKDRQLHEIQPASMADWEKERERYEFAQAARMFKPVAGLVFDKFVTASTGDADLDPLKPVERTIYQHGTQDMRDAAKKKMFGPLTRTIEIWVPNKLLCKRFDVPEPDVTETEMSLSKKKKGKYNVFDYYEAYQQNKTVKEGPELKNEEPKSNTEIHEVLDEKSNEITSTESMIPQDQIEKEEVKVVETFKTSKTIFLEESSNSNTPKTSISTNTTKSYYKKAEPVEPQPVIPTDPKEKKDLFRAIFLSSSSESEDEKPDDEQKKQQQQKNNNKMDEMKKIVLEEEHTTKFVEPIVNASKGIFSNLDWSKVNRNPINSGSSTSKEEIPKEMTTPSPKTVEKTIERDEDTYGPKLPAQKDWKATVPTKCNVAKDSSSSSDDEWLEANSISGKTSKTNKKHKKHKSKHKKHKSKHKKKKSKH